MAVVAIFLFAGCACEEDDDGDAGTARSDAAPSDGGGFDARSIAGLMAIVLEPSSAELVSLNGSRTEQRFTVVGTFSDGSMRPIPAGSRFEIDSVRLGSIDEASGTFIANGIIGGSAIVTATVPNPRGGVFVTTAPLTVRIEQSFLGDGVPADVADRFAVPSVRDDARRATTVYPLDRAVMPQNVFPADVQWLNGASGDLFRIAFSKPSFSAAAYVAHDGALGNHWLVNGEMWRSFAQTDPDAEGTITVDRLEAASGELIEGEPVRIRFARAALTGSVYYWDIEDGQIVRIDDGTAARTNFMPNPPLECVGCHAVSNSGRYMAGRLGGGDNTGTVFDLTTDLTGDPPPSVFPVGDLYWQFSSWSPDDSRLVVETNGFSTRALKIYDPFAGVEVPTTGTLPTNATHPAWSPDGTRIAYVSDVDDWGGAFTTGNIYLLEVTDFARDAFGGSSLIHRGADLAGELPGGTADSYPTWSPDSELIAFAHGTGCRSDTEAIPMHYSALYLMRRDGSGVVRLSNVSPSGTTEDFQPRFSPFEQGGYYWLSFLSRRDYGNAEAGTRGRQMQQIWVTAIRNDAAPGEDPSSAPYWLPGQSTASRNISAYWAPRPCRPDGERCSVGTECCGGDCRPNEAGELVCSPPPPDRCRMENETCSSSADCCEELVCSGNVCVNAPI